MNTHLHRSSNIFLKIRYCCAVRSQLHVAQKYSIFYIKYAKCLDSVVNSWSMGYKMSLLDKKSVFLPLYGKMFRSSEDEMLEMVESYIVHGLQPGHVMCQGD